MCDAAPFTPELCHLDELKHVYTDNIGRSASPSRQAHETTDLGVTSTTSTIAHCSPGALTSRERTPSPCLQDTSASSIASVSPEFPPHWVSFVGQGRHTHHHKARRVVRGFVVGAVIGFVAASSFALLYVFAVLPHNRADLVRRQRTSWASTSCNTCTQPDARDVARRTSARPWHGVFSLPEHPLRKAQHILAPEWRRCTRREQPVATSPHDVPLVLGRTFLFLEAQRSGQLPDDHRVWWRGNSSQSDGADMGWDLSGGWFEGDSRVKSTFSIAYATARLSWTCLFYRDALERTIFQGSTVWNWCVREVAWAASYLLKCHQQHNGRLSLVVQVGSVPVEKDYFGRAETSTTMRPTTVANASHPATEVGAEYVAALAFAHRLLGHAHAELARACLLSAQVVFTWSRLHRGSHAAWSAEVCGHNVACSSNRLLQAKALYPTTASEQHLFFAAAALFWVLKCPEQGRRGMTASASCDEAASGMYFRAAMALWQRADVARRCTYAAADRDSVCYDAAMLLVQATGQVDSIFAYHIEALLDAWAWPAHTSRVTCAPHTYQSFPSAQHVPSGSFTPRQERLLTRMLEAMNGARDYVCAARAPQSPDSAGRSTPLGLRYSPRMASSRLRNACAVSSLALMYAELPGLTPHQRGTARCLARSQLGYVLGNTGRSFVVGYGSNSPKQARSRDASCTLDEDAQSPSFCRKGSDGAWAADRSNPHVLYGALVAGPDGNDRFADHRHAQQHTAVALDANVALTSALAGLAQAPPDLWTMPCARLVAN